MTDISGTASNKFFILGLVYILVFAGFLWLSVVQESGLSFQKSGCVDAMNCDDKIASILVDQLKDNKKGYANNVWTTLGTIIGAIGMVLGSDKFQKILVSSRSVIPGVQVMILILFVLHAFAYCSYQNENVRLMGLLGAVVESIEFYKGYLITVKEIASNLIFDTILFLLLAYMIDRIRSVKIEAKGA